LNDLYSVAEAVQFAIWKDIVKGSGERELTERKIGGMRIKRREERREWKRERRSCAIPQVSGAFAAYSDVFI